MKPGISGLAGGGIYFTDNPEDTDHKALKMGVVLKAYVYLGKSHQIAHNGESDLNFKKIIAL